MGAIVFSTQEDVSTRITILYHIDHKIKIEKFKRIDTSVMEKLNEL